MTPKLSYSKTLKEYPPSTLYVLRRKLKIDVYHRRRIPGEQPKCAICGKDVTIEGGGDLHEVFFTRGDVQGVKDKENNYAIFHPCNVVLVHPGQCHLTAQHTPEGKCKCAAQIVAYEGAAQVQRYICQMARIYKYRLLAQEQLNLVLQNTFYGGTGPSA